MSADDPFHQILGQSGAAQSMRLFGRRAAAIDAPVLLLGESGTGKGVLARAIHDASRRARAPLVAVNCAAIPETLFESEFFGHVRGAFTGAQYAHKGLFEQAHGGTLFLDEVAELPLSSQAKLLTVIEDREVRKIGGERVSPFDARIIAATAADLQQAVAGRALRRDLYHRLLVLLFTIPRLRVRHGDILMLARVFAQKYASTYGRDRVSFGAAANEFLERWIWPGNVRELAHVVEAAVVACDDGLIETLTSLEAPRMTNLEQLGGIALFGKARYSFAGSAADERRMIHAAIEKCAGNKTRAAAQLGMSRNTLLNKLRRLPDPQ
ncbi:MAG: sigma 54-interacting transcriptional regulator [Gemmatimonadota bacterium]